MALTPNEAYAAKQPFVDKETLEAFSLSSSPRRFIYTTRRASAVEGKKCATPLHGTRALRNTLPSRPTPTRRSSPFSTNTAAAAIARAIRAHDRPLTGYHGTRHHVLEPTTHRLPTLSSPTSWVPSSTLTTSATSGSLSALRGPSPRPSAAALTLAACSSFQRHHGQPR